MYQSVLTWLMLVFFSQALFATQVSWPCQRTLNSRVSDNHPPYSYLDSNGQLTGYRVELIHTVFAHLNCNVSISTDMPWKRALILVESGDIDLLVNASESAERQQYAHFSVAYDQEWMALYGRVADIDHIALSSLTALAEVNVRLGIIRGNYYGQQFVAIQQQRAIKRKLVEVVDKDQLYSLLLRQRIDLYLDYYPNGDWSLHASQLHHQIKRHPLPPQEIGTVHFMFSKASVTRTLVDRVDQVLLQMQHDGSLRSLQHKYGLADSAVVQDNAIKN